VAFVRKQPAQHLSDFGLVVDDQDRPGTVRGWHRRQAFARQFGDHAQLARSVAELALFDVFRA